MGRLLREKTKEAVVAEAALFAQSGRPCPDQYPRNIYARLYGLGYHCVDDRIEIGSKIYPVKFFQRQQRTGKLLTRQNILSVFLFGYMPEDVERAFFADYMRGIDRMIAAYTDFASAKIKADMSFCMEQERLCRYIAEYCVRETGANAFLGNIPLVYERSTGRIYVKETAERMPLHYAMHMDDLKKVFLEAGC